MWVNNVCQTEEGSCSSNWNESRDVASLPFSFPPCTLQSRAATGREAAVQHRGNWSWFIGGQSSQRELAQHWQKARQGHDVNISKPTQPSPNPHGLDATTPDQLSPCRRSACSCMCVFPILCLWICVRALWESLESETHIHKKTCHKKWQAVSLNWRKKPLSSSSINSCWQSLCKDS